MTVSKEAKSICRGCFHSYVCEQFNEHRDSDNKKCHFYNDHYVPAADVVEVKHGRWELYGNDDDCGCSYFCSVCGASYDEDWFYTHGKYTPFEHCPRCISVMDGGADNG